MNRNSLIALRNSSEVGIGIADEYYQRLRAVTRAALESEGASLAGSLIRADETHVASEAVKAAEIQDEVERVANEQANLAFIGHFLNLLPRQIGRVSDKSSISVKDEQTLHSVLDTTYWCSIGRGNEIIRHASFRPFYVIGYSYEWGSALLATPAQDYPYFKADRPATTRVSAYRPTPTPTAPLSVRRKFKKLSKEFSQIHESDATLFDIKNLDSYVDRNKRAYVVDEHSQSIRKGNEIIPHRRYWPKAPYDNCSFIRDYGLKQLPLEVFGRYNVDHWLGRLAARFEVGKQYLQLIDMLIAKEPKPLED